MNKSLIAVAMMGVVLSFSFIVGIPKKRFDTVRASLDQAEALTKDIVVQMEKADSRDAYGRHLQALWSLRYFILVYKGMENPLEAANFGRNAIEHDLKKELEKAPKNIARELYKDIKPFVQRTVEFFVQTNQLEVAQVVATGFTDGTGFYFV